jgi:hypothetical protein
MAASGGNAMTATEPVPTDEQLREYAADLDPLYRDIMAAYQFAEPLRRRGDGLYESTLRNFLRNLASIKPADLDWVLRSGPVGRHPYKFSRAIDDYGDEEFSAAMDRLIEHGFIEPRNPNGLGLLTPTPVGERMIAIITERPEPMKDPPALEKPTWR